jgi:hypothetical protein
MKSFVVVSLLSCVVVGCSSGNGSAGPAGNGDPHSCWASATLSGGVDHSFGANPACSGQDMTTQVLAFLGTDAMLFEGGSIGLTFDFDVAPALGQTGEVAGVVVSVREVGPEPADPNEFAPTFEWEFPAGACTLDITSTSRDPDPDFAWLWFAADGVCDAEAVAVAPNTKAAVSLSPFSINTFVTLPE